MKRKIISIFSYEYSGSTMLDCMLGNSEFAFSCGEIYALFRPHRPHHFNISCSCGDPNCPIWDKLKKIAPSKVHLSIFDYCNVSYVIDSSKHLTWMIDVFIWASKSGISVSNILLWKHPINYAYSAWKRGRDPFRSLNGWYEYYRRSLSIGFDFLIVNYEKLVANPSTVLEYICKHIELPYFEGKEFFWHKRHHILFGNAGLIKQLKSSNTHIRSSIQYHSDFLPIKDRLQNFLDRDQRFSTILQILAKNVYYPEKPFRHRPLWYFKDLLHLYFLKYKILGRTILCKKR